MTAFESTILSLQRVGLRVPTAQRLIDMLLLVSALAKLLDFFLPDLFGFLGLIVELEETF